jgi:hypothetical protein
MTEQRKPPHEGHSRRDFLRGAGGAAAAAMFAVPLVEATPASAQAPNIGCSPAGDAGGLIRVTHDGHEFVDAHGQAFVPWGLNYDRTYYQGTDVLLEQLIDLNPAKLGRDFAVARGLGANVIRIFPQLNRYLPRLQAIDEAELAKLDVAIETARRNQLRVDLTGLTMIDARTVPDWVNTASDEEIIAGQELFWATVSSRYAGDPTIFCFNLQNEPYVNWSDGSVAPTACYVMPEGMEYCYLTPHLKSVSAAWAAWVHEHYRDAATVARAWSDFPLAGETYASPAIPITAPRPPAYPRLRDFHLFRLEQATGWTRRMARAIHRTDHTRLVTTGLLPESVMPVDPSGFTPVFGDYWSGALVDELDFLCVHLYPGKTGDDPLKLNLRYQEMALSSLYELGKPAVVEEWLPLGPVDWLEWFDSFVAMSKPVAAGWLSHYQPLLYDGSPDDPAAPPPWPEGWFDRFSTQAAQFRSQGCRLPRPHWDGELQLDWMAMMESGDVRASAFDAYRTRRADSHGPLRVRWRHRRHPGAGE